MPCNQLTSSKIWLGSLHLLCSFVNGRGNLFEGWHIPEKETNLRYVKNKLMVILWKHKVNQEKTTNFYLISNHIFIVESVEKSHHMPVFFTLPLRTGETSATFAHICDDHISEKKTELFARYGKSLIREAGRQQRHTDKKVSCSCEFLRLKFVTEIIDLSTSSI